MMREGRNEKKKEKTWGLEGVFERFVRLEEEGNGEGLRRRNRELRE